MLDVAVKTVIPEARTVCYVERGAYEASVIVAGMEATALDTAPVWDTVETFDGRPWRGVVDIVIASPPCQPYSVAGRHRGNDDERAFGPDGEGPTRHLLRVIEEIGPVMCFFENVPTWVTKGHFERLWGELSGLGYQWEKPLFIAAQDVGASHRRERVFILAHSLRECGQAGTERMGWAPGTDSGGGGQRSDVEYTKCIHDQRGCFDQTNGASAAVGHPNLSYDRSGSKPRKPGSRGDRPDYSGDHVAVTGGWGLQERYECGKIPVHDNDTEVTGFRLPFFPPGVGAIEQWRRILDREPAIEPAVCGMANGMASRADRLRIVGNGVVPLQAAIAFDILLSEAGL